MKYSYGTSPNFKTPTLSRHCPRHSALPFSLIPPTTFQSRYFQICYIDEETWPTPLPPPLGNMSQRCSWLFPLHKTTTMRSYLLKLLSSCKFRSLEGQHEPKASPFCNRISCCGLAGGQRRQHKLSRKTSPPQQYVLNPNSMPGNGWNEGTVIT